MTHSLYSHDQDRTICFFEEFNPSIIKAEIILHLKEFPNDTVEHCKEFNKIDVRKYYGNEILNLYRVNPKNNKVSLVITRGDKISFKNIEDNG